MNKKNIIIYVFLIIVSTIFFVQCKKEITDIGADLINSNDRINTSLIDTITVAAYTKKLDKLKTDNVVFTLLGNYIDPVFGKTKASFATQMLMSNSQPYNDSVTQNGITTDSLIIYLKYPAYKPRVYGNSEKDCEINISKINKFMGSEDTYYSNYDVTNLDTSAGITYTFNPKTVIEHAENLAQEIWQNKIDSALAHDEDTSKIEKGNPEAILSIKMPDNIKDDVHTALVQSVKNNQTFVEQFNGLYFSPSNENDNNSISIFDYLSLDTKAVLYYHKNNEPTKVKEYPLYFNRFTTHFNIFNHEFSSGNILTDFNEQTNQLDTVIYLQGMGGLSAGIKFPYIEEMISQGKWAVTKAEIIFTVPPNTENKYPAPEQLMLYRIDENGEMYSLEEFFNKDKYYGEQYSENKYTFDITLFMQRVLKGKYKNSELLLKVKNEPINPSRVVIGANNHSNTIKFNLIASKL